MSDWLTRAVGAAEAAEVRRVREDAQATVKPDPDRMAELRINGAGMLDARRRATAEALERAINQAQTVEDLKPVLRTLLRGSV